MSENISNESLNVCTKENLKSLVHHKFHRIAESSSHQFFISLHWKCPSVWKIYFFPDPRTVVSTGGLKTPESNLQKSSYFFIMQTWPLNAHLSRILIRLLELFCTAYEVLTVLEITNRGTFISTWIVMANSRNALSGIIKAIIHEIISRECEDLSHCKLFSVDTIHYHAHPSKKKKTDEKLYIRSEVSFIDAASPDMTKVGHSIKRFSL